MKKTGFLFMLVLIGFISYGQSLNQTVKGQVVDRDSQMPLPGANVVVLNTEPLKGASTDAEGYFRMEGVPVGRYNIEVSFLGYYSEVVPEVVVGTGKEVVLDVQLKESSQTMEKAVIKPHIRKDRAQNEMATVSARTFTVEETRRYAGGIDDPARMVSAFAGVTVGNPQDNAIVIRGNAPKGVLWRVEGIDVPAPNHFPDGNIAGGGFVSIISNQLLDNSDFYTGAFPAEYGNALAGVFDMKLRRGNKDTREYAFQAGLMGIDASAEGPFVKGKKATYLLNYRYSTLGLLKNLNLIPSEQIPEYQDLSFKLNFPTKKTGVFSFWGLGAVDHNEEPEERDSSQWEYSWDRMYYDYNSKMGTMGLTHRYILGENTYINSTAAISGKEDIWDMQRLDDHVELYPVYMLENRSSKLTFHSLFNHKFNSRHTNQTGVYYNTLFFNMDLAGANIEEDPGTYRRFVDEKGHTNLFQFYTQSRYQLSHNFYVNAGIHAEYLQVNQNFSFEPRIALNWQFVSNHSLSLGYGKHSQMEELKVYFINNTDDGSLTYPNKDLDFSRAHHVVLAYDWLISNDLRLKMEPYFQHVYDVPGIRDSTFSMINFRQDLAFREALQNNTHGQNFGIDMTLERFLQNNYYYLITASLFDSWYEASNGNRYPTRYNKGHVFNVLFGKEFFVGKSKTNVLGINARLNFIGGERYHPVLEEESKLQQRIIQDYSSPFSNQFGDMHYMDMTITFRNNKANYSSIWALQVKNILSTPMHAGFMYNYPRNTVDESKAEVVLPVLSYKIEF